MKAEVLLGPWVRRFLLEYMIEERNLSLNTQHSYRDTIVLLLQFLSKEIPKRAGDIEVLDVSVKRVQAFLTHLEKARGCAVRTRNQRLCAIHSLASFIESHSPEHIVWATQIRGIPVKKAAQNLIPYFDKGEIDELLKAPNLDKELGRRDRTLLLFLYNSGCRADEVARLTIANLDLRPPSSAGLNSVTIVGKGGKVRRCPLWPRTVEGLRTLIGSRPGDQRVFLNRRGQPLTRFGVYRLVRHYASLTSKKFPSLARKRASPHTIRHTSATQLLRAGVDLNTIREWLGHVSLDTTNIYTEVDFESKAKALELCEVNPKLARRRKESGIFGFLRKL